MTSELDPIIRIQGIAGARSACRVMGNRSFVLLSPENAALSHGAQWFGDLVTLIRSEFPDTRFKATLDCRGRLSGALAAIEIGIDCVIIDPLDEVQVQSLRDLGRQAACAILTAHPAAIAIYEMEDDRLPDHELDRRLKTSLR